jgi:hypothetical protein
MAVDRADADSCGAGDVLDLRLEAVLGELLTRGVDDQLAVAARVGALSALTGRGGGGVDLAGAHSSSE